MAFVQLTLLTVKTYLPLGAGRQLIACASIGKQGSTCPAEPQDLPLGSGWSCSGLLEGFHKKVAMASSSVGRLSS
jgi:hypothetical protein